MQTFKRVFRPVLMVVLLGVPGLSIADEPLLLKWDLQRETDGGYTSRMTPLQSDLVLGITVGPSEVPPLPSINIFLELNASPSS